MGNLRNKLSILLLVLMAAFLMADQNLLPPNYQQIMAEFGISETQMGLVSTIFVATSALITIVWGFLSDIKGRKKLLVVGVLLGEIPCFLTAFVSSYYELLLMRLFTGIGVGSIIPIGYSLIADMFPSEERGKGYAFIQTAFGFGTLFGMIMAGLIGGWRLPFILASVPNFILAPLFYVIAEEPKRGAGEEEVRKLIERGVEYTYRLSWEAVRKSFRTKTNLLIFLQGLAGTVPWGVLMYWLVSFLIVTRGMEKETATFVLLILGIATVIGTLVGGYVGDYFERRSPGGRALITGAAIFIGMLAAIGVIVYPLPSELSPLQWALLALYSIGLLQLVSFAGPNVTAIISQVNLPEDRGTVFGVFNIIDNVGKALGPLFGGFLIEALRKAGYTNAQAYEYTLIIGSLFWTLCALVWLWIRHQYPKDREEVRGILRSRAQELLGGEIA
ncbi:MFS transporter [Thermococcus camini]|uniref:Predicted arabinose efflux permease, MFS family n=1 Tax=Thermococcus camini TaxID=2016373 RepID=A0A7G2D8Z0_9EURY|nr:MFS transporter [Thermococcus camini]CAD5244956.1 Predicted arabinose efflux permease, MFS family [Thermococcus camini]